MRVLKFGGTSVESAAKLKRIAELIPENESVIIVLSAMAGTTNALIKIAETAKSGDKKKAKILIKELKAKYLKVVSELYSSIRYKRRSEKYVLLVFENIIERNNLIEINENEIIASGEILSTGLFYYLLMEMGKAGVLLSAMEFMRINSDREPDYYYILKNLKRNLKLNSNEKFIYVTQGFICRNYFGQVDNLGRGGSDYTAAIIGKVLNCEEVQIWTDIDGLHNNDPRYVDNTRPIRNISFNEAAELAYFGAKILHPATIYPCVTSNIPVILKNTLNPSDIGTRISKEYIPSGIKAIAAKDDITVIKIKSLRMLMAYGFLNKVFEIFSKFKTPIDIVTTSEVSVSLTIDNDNMLNEIINELEAFSVVDTEKEQCIICIIGDFSKNIQFSLVKIFNALEGVSIKMISFGYSGLNISIIINKNDKERALNVLHNVLDNQMAMPLVLSDLIMH